MMGSTPKAHYAVAVFGYETELMRRLPLTLIAESDELLRHYCPGSSRAAPAPLG